MAVSHQKYYDAVADELAQKSLKSGLWARAVAEAGTDDGRARAVYIRLRADELRDEDIRSRPVAFRLTRVTYPLVQFGSLFVAGFFIEIYFGDIPSTKEVLPYTISALYLITAAMRMRDIGHKVWPAFALLIPIVNIIVAGELYARPSGYAKTESPDRTMKIVFWLYYASVIVLIGASILWTP